MYKINTRKTNIRKKQGKTKNILNFPKNVIKLSENCHNNASSVQRFKHCRSEILYGTVNDGGSNTVTFGFK